MLFENKVVIITGSASGIGLATAKRFAKEKAKIVLADINADKLKQAETEVRNAGAADVWLSVCDVSNEQNVEATVDGAIKNLGGFDVMVNNAGMMIFKKIEEQTEDDWMKILSVDLLGAFFFTKQAFLKMKSGGVIVNVSSIHAVETTPNVATYAAAKSALLSLTRSASVEGKPKKIRVNAVLPGAIDTPMLWDNPNVKAGLEKIEMTDVGKPEDIADVIAYLASDEAAFVQGAAIRVDGGRLDRL
ncbi:MAG: SDR family oxidoreductase [Parafilimonas sp.]|nr:SDR family oxidoreductase [Parafilimonas sp.]